MSVPDEFEAFFERSFEPLTGALWLYCGDRVVAEECAQEALARVARDWGRVSQMTAPQGWLHRVAFNLANSVFRRRAIERRALGRLGPTATTEPGPDEELGDQLVVRRAVASLSRKQRQAVVLFYFADLPVSQVADVMGVPVNTVKSWLSRARSALAKDLTVEFGEQLQEDFDVH